MKTKLIGKKKFTFKNQKDFAGISCDYNPIHMNALIARRSISGNQIVHGVNILLTALNFLFKNKYYFKFNQIKCIFHNPANIGEYISFVKSIYKNKLLIEIKNETARLATIILEYNNNIKKEFYIDNKSLKKINKINKKNINKNFIKTSNVIRNYKINLNNFKFSNKYENLKEIFTKNQFRSILSLSYFVGMVCPGINSILSSLEINLNEKLEKKNNINFSLSAFDKRISLLTTKFSSDLFGEIKAFIHPGQTLQPSIKKIKEFIKSQDFLGSNSLIIGGSRGLGELTAKILASGKGNVSITYFHGEKEAKKLKKNIKLETGQDCKIHKLNILKDNFKNRIKKFSKYDFIFYYATPKISTNKSNKFNYKIYKNFCEFYIKKFKNICEILDRDSKKKITIFYPSTIFIEQKPQHLTEYVKAKLAAEKLIKKLNSKLSMLRIISNRLPRLKTDQTAGVVSNFKNQNIEVMVPIIKSIILKKLI